MWFCPHIVVLDPTNYLHNAEFKEFAVLMISHNAEFFGDIAPFEVWEVPGDQKVGVSGARVDGGR